MAMQSFFRTMVLFGAGVISLLAQGETLRVQGATTVNPVVRGGAGEILEQGCCDAVFGNPECRALFERMEEEGGE